MINNSLNESTHYKPKTNRLFHKLERKKFNNSVGTDCSKSSSEKDNSTLLSDKPNEIVPIVQENISNFNIVDKISFQLVGETVSQVTIQCFKKIKYSNHK